MCVNIFRNTNYDHKHCYMWYGLTITCYIVNCWLLVDIEVDVFTNWLCNNLLIFVFQHKMQMRKKRKKEREALGDKVSFLSVFPTLQLTLNKIYQWSFFSILLTVGTTKRGAEDNREPKGVWRDYSWPRRWRGMSQASLSLFKPLWVLLVSNLHEFVFFPVTNRLHLMKELMSFPPTSMGWQTPKCSSQHQTDQEGWVAAAV